MQDCSISIADAFELPQSYAIDLSFIFSSAGVGRTGTFVAIDSLLEQASEEGQVDVYHTVQMMRTKRVNMVQTLVRYRV